MTNIKHIIILFCLALAGTGLFAQETDTAKFVVSGTVYSVESLEPIGFVTIDNADISSGFTEIDGTYNIEVNSFDNVLTFQLMGFQTQEVVLAGRKYVDVYMTPVGYPSFNEEANLYYTSPKMAYVTQAISNLSYNNTYENANETGALSADVAFKNVVSGLEVKARSGMPGIGSDLFLRGFSSLNGSNRPLIVLDGMIYDDNEYGESTIWGQRKNALSAIDISDIENISIVKDAASIYGSKAANGVIYIRTNHAVNQSTSIELNLSGGINMEPEGLPMMEADEYRLYMYDMLEGTGISSDSIGRVPYMINNTGYSDYYRYHNNTDWQKQVFTNSYNRKVGMRIMGGDDVALYALSVNYAKNEGVIEKTDFSKFSMRFNSDINISKIFTVNSSLSFIRGVQNLRSGTSMTGKDNPFYTSLIKAPFLNPYVRTNQGIVSPVFEDYDIFGVSNPSSLLSENNSLDQLSRNYRVFGAFNLNAKVHENLTLSNQIGIMFDKDRESFFIPRTGIEPTVINIGVVNNQNGFRTIKHFAVSNDLNLKYNKTFDYTHDLGFVAGMRLNLNMVEEDWATGANTASDQITSTGKGDALFNKTGGFLNDWNSLTYYASLNYGYKKKYFIGSAVSVDGATHFGEEADGLHIGDYTYGIFPSVSGAWLLSSEPFMSGLNFINLLKLRASYGLTGNDNIGLYHRYKYYQAKNYLGQQGVIRGNIQNPQIGWENNTKMNLGLDIELLKSRLYLSADIYKNETTDLVEVGAASVFSGEDSYVFNNGGFTTTGVDLAVNARILNTAVKWDLGINIATYKTEVTKLNKGSMLSELYGATVLSQVGQPIGAFYGYETNGVYATTEQAQSSGLYNYKQNTDVVGFGAGDVIFVNHSSQNIKQSDVRSIIDDNDRTVIGDPTPDFFGGINTRLKYKRIALMANAGFSVGNDVFNALRYQLEGMSTYNNQTQAVLNRWRYEGQVTDIPKASYGDGMMNNRFSDRWIEDGSYFRLNNVTISYSLPIHTGFMDQPEIYVTGNNLATITNYRGLDPDFSVSNSTLSKGVDVGLMPQFRSFLIGVKIKL